MPHFTVHLVGMVLGPVVCIVEFAWAPVDFKLFLAFAVAKPMEAHVHGFGSLGLDFMVDYALSCCVVGLQRGRSLLVTEFFENDANKDCLARHDVESRELGLSR